MKLTMGVLDGNARAKTTLAGKPVYLSRIYVKSTESWIGLPTVEYVEAKGVCVATGEEIVERIKQ